MGKKSKKIRLSRVEQEYVTDSSEFTAEMARFGLAGIHRYIERMGKSVTTLRMMMEADPLPGELVRQEMDQVIYSVECIGDDIAVVNNSLIRYIRTGCDTSPFNRLGIPGGKSSSSTSNAPVMEHKKIQGDNS